MGIGKITKKDIVRQRIARDIIRFAEEEDAHFVSWMFNNCEVVQENNICLFKCLELLFPASEIVTLYKKKNNLWINKVL